MCSWPGSLPERIQRQLRDDWVFPPQSPFQPDSGCSCTSSLTDSNHAGPLLPVLTASYLSALAYWREFSQQLFLQLVTYETDRLEALKWHEGGAHDALARILLVSCHSVNVSNDRRSCQAVISIPLFRLTGSCTAHEASVQQSVIQIL